MFADTDGVTLGSAQVTGEFSFVSSQPAKFFSHDITLTVLFLMVINESIL